MKNNNVKHGTRNQSGKPLLSPRKQEYVYHWDRIIGAGVIFLVLCGLAGYGLYWWFGSSPKEEFEMAETLPGAEVAVEDTRPRPKEELIHQEIEEDPQSFAHAEEDRLPPAVAETTDSRSNSQDTQAPLSNEARIAEDNPAQQSAENKPLETEPSSTEMAQVSTTDQANETTGEEAAINELDLEDSEPANAAQVSEEMVAIPTHEELSEPQAEIRQNIPLATQGESPAGADTTLTVDTRNSPFQLREVEILMPSVKRFLLAKSVSNREPKGELNEISFTADGSAAVWVYSELIDRKGSRLKYVWLHGGKRIVTVPVNVGGNRWRSYSSKVINQSMRGAWRVELQDGKGRLMASADFFVE
jgi:hypothetical protein